MRTGDEARSSWRDCELFSDLSRQDLRRIESLTTMIEVHRGCRLVEQGTAGHEFFFVAEGRATACRDGVRLARFGPGSFFGELALLDQGVRTATVIADSDMWLLVASRAEFAALQKRVPSVVSKIAVELGKRLRSTDEMLCGPTR